jgi:hypothetical protein
MVVSFCLGDGRHDSNIVTLRAHVMGAGNNCNIDIYLGQYIKYLKYVSQCLPLWRPTWD